MNETKLRLENMDDTDEILLREIGIFINKVGEAAKMVDPGKNITIPCDCGGALTIGKAKINGHIHARCNKCDKSLFQ